MVGVPCFFACMAEKIGVFSPDIDVSLICLPSLCLIKNLVNDGTSMTVITNDRRVDPKIRSRFFVISCINFYNNRFFSNRFYQVYALKVQSINTLLSENLAGLPKTIVIISLAEAFSATATKH